MTTRLRHATWLVLIGCLDSGPTGSTDVRRDADPGHDADVEATTTRPSSPCDDDVDCEGPGMICLEPAFPATCQPRGTCFQDIHCTRALGAGHQCRCADGAVLADEYCQGDGLCEPIPGEPFWSDETLALAPMPSGGCAPSEVALLEVAGVGSAGAIRLYVELDGVTTATMPPWLELRSPDGALAWARGVAYQGAEERVVAGPVEDLPASVDGTWRLCNRFNSSGTTPTVRRWGLFVRGAP